MEKHFRGANNATVEVWYESVCSRKLKYIVSHWVYVHAYRICV